MITPNIIKSQLFQFLPVYTDLFSEVITAGQSNIISGDELTVTKTDHGLETGDVIVVAEAISRLTITGASLSDGLLTYTTSSNHDLSSVRRDGRLFDYNQATLTGIPLPGESGTFPVVDIPDQNKFTIEATASPSPATGILLEKRSLYVSPATVTKVDDDRFIIPNPDTALPDGFTINTIKYCSKSRIYVAATIERAKAMYTKVEGIDEAVLFIVMRPESASKDRHAYSDAIATVKAQNPIRLKYLPEVDFFVFLPTPDDLSGAKAQNVAYVDIRTAIRKAMYAHIFLTDETVDTQFAAVEASNSPEDYNTAVYVHSYSYQIPYEISFEQGDTFRTNVSARNILINSKMFDNEGALVSVNIPLEP